MVLFCKEQGKSLSITLHVIPRARRTEIVGVHGDALKVKVAAPPVEGAANEELIRFFAEFFKISQSDVRMKRGATSRKKVIEVDGITTSELTMILLREKLLTIKLG